MIINENIDSGTAFDWGRTSSDYAKYRDIYPESLYRYLYESGLCTMGQKVLDIGTGTGVLPRNMYQFGAKFVGTDISSNQIEQAKKLAESQEMDIEFYEMSAEKCDFPKASFDVITACQCFKYFNHELLAPLAQTILKAGGRFAIIFMAWLPGEDEIARQSEELVLKYSPKWQGCNMVRRIIPIPEVYNNFFTIEKSTLFDANISFTRESWRGRMRACRGVGASLNDTEAERFDKEHAELLEKIAPEHFEILHFCTVTILKTK